jgi:hypothetical protein
MQQHLQHLPQHSYEQQQLRASATTIIIALRPRPLLAWYARPPTMGAVSRGSHTDFCSPVEKCQEKSRRGRTHSPSCPIHHARRRTDLSPKRRQGGLLSVPLGRWFSPMLNHVRRHTSPLSFLAICKELLRKILPTKLL